MRAIFNQELKQLGSDLESMANQVATAIERAAESLRQGDIVIAEQVIDADERINDLQRDIDDLCVMLLARQQPVAGDLRNVLSALRMAQTLERQGDLARHVAAIARGRYPEPPLPEPVLGLILEMADLAVRAGSWRWRTWRCARARTSPASSRRGTWSWPPSFRPTTPSSMPCTAAPSR